MFIFCLIASGITVAQDDEFTEESPKYVSKADRDHYNRRDLTGKRMGVWKIFNRDRKLISEIEYERDLKHGRCIKYHQTTGKPLEERTYVYGILEGSYKKYTATGEIVAEGEFVAGKKSELWTYNYSSGKIKSTGQYKNGLKEGKWEYYNRKEELKKTVEYKNGKSPEDLVVPVVAKPKDADKKDKKKVVKKPDSAPVVPAPVPSPETK